MRAVRDSSTRDVNERRVGILQVYRAVTLPGGEVDVVPLVDVAAPSMPQGWPRAAVDRLAARVAGGLNSEPRMLEPVSGGGDLIRAASVIRNAARQLIGVVVASDYLSGDLAARSRRMTKAYEDYTQLRVLRQPLAGVYLSFFVMVTLLILVSSTWMGFYLAKRITRPVQMLSFAAREIGQGRYDQRIEHEASDEFGSMIEAFNSMAAELASSRRRLERAAVDLERKNQEVEGRRRYIETILERVATGVVSIDPAGRIGTVNAAAMRLLEVDATSVGRPAVDVFARTDLKPINAVLDQAARARADAFAQEVAVVREGRELHVARRGHAPDRRRRRLRGQRARARRRHAAHPHAEGRRLARGRAAAGARDQESADANSVVRRAHAPQAVRRSTSRSTTSCRSARRRSSARWSR